MRKLMIVLLPVLSLVALLATGCGPREEALEWEEIAQCQLSGFDPSGERPRLVVVTNREDAHSLLKGHVSSNVLDQILDTDFSTQIVLAVFQGYKGTLDYSVEVEDVRQNENVIVVDARFLEPDPGEVYKTAESSPYYVLKIKKTPDLRGEFIFVLIADGQEIMRQSRAIP